MCVCTCAPMHTHLVVQLCPTLCHPMDCSPPGSFVRGILQAKVLEWVAISFSRGSSWTRHQTHISCIGRWILCHWASREAPGLGIRLTKWFSGETRVIWRRFLLFHRCCLLIPGLATTSETLRSKTDFLYHGKITRTSSPYGTCSGSSTAPGALGMLFHPHHILPRQAGRQAGRQALVSSPTCSLGNRETGSK